MPYKLCLVLLVVAATIQCQLDHSEELECHYDGEVLLLNQATFHFSSEAEYVVTTPALCINSSSIYPFCTSAITYDLLDEICVQHLNFEDGYIGDIFDSAGLFEQYLAIEPPTHGLVYYCDGNNCSLSEGCVEYEGYAIVSCSNNSQQSEPGTIIPIIVESTLSRGSVNITSRVAVLSECGIKLDVCADTVVNAESLFYEVCDFLGSLHSSIQLEPMQVQYVEMYGRSNNLLYASNVMCPNGLCTFNITNNCSGYPLIVSCYSNCIEGDIRLVEDVQLSKIDMNISSASGSGNWSSEDIYGPSIIGVLELCYNEEWSSFCSAVGADFEFQSSNTLVPSACEGLGYSGGQALDPSTLEDSFMGSGPVLDIECFDYPTSFEIDCNVSLSNKSYCTDHSQDFVIQCNAAVESCYSNIGQPSLSQLLLSQSTDSEQFNLYYLSICDPYTDTYAAVCNNIASDELANAACISSGYDGGAIVNEVEYDHFELQQYITPSGLIKFSCLYGTYECSLMFSEHGEGCLYYDGPALVLCYSSFDEANESCSVGQVTVLGMSEGSLPNGTTYTSYAIGICFNEKYIPVCADAVPEEILQLFL